MNYILLIYADPAAEAALDEAQMQAIYAAHEALGAEMEQAGVLRGGAELKPPATATTVRFTGVARTWSTGLSPRPRSSSAATT